MSEKRTWMAADLAKVFQEVPKIIVGSDDAYIDDLQHRCNLLAGLVLDARAECDEALAAAQANGHTPVQSLQRLTQKLRAAEAERDALQIKLGDSFARGLKCFQDAELWHKEAMQLRIDLTTARAEAVQWHDSYRAGMGAQDELIAERDTLAAERDALKAERTPEYEEALMRNQTLRAECDELHELAAERKAHADILERAVNNLRSQAWKVEAERDAALRDLADRSEAQAYSLKNFWTLVDEHEALAAKLQLIEATQRTFYDAEARAVAAEADAADLRDALERRTCCEGCPDCQHFDVHAVRRECGTLEAQAEQFRAVLKRLGCKFRTVGPDAGTLLTVPFGTWEDGFQAAVDEMREQSIIVLGDKANVCATAAEAGLARAKLEGQIEALEWALDAERTREDSTHLGCVIVARDLRERLAELRAELKKLK